MKNTLSGKTAIVTGGCRGIGKAIAVKLAVAGARVFALDFKIPEEGEIFIDDDSIAQLISCIQTDVTNDESVKDSVNKVLAVTERIDILVNNAGITRDNLLMRMNENEWDSVLSTNLKGAFLCTRAVTRIMMSQRNGRIINIGSVVGSMGNAGQSNYSASKAGLIGFSKSIAKELASRNILVNVVAPGYVRTPMTDVLTEEQRAAFLQTVPLKRAAEPEDIANVVYFFTSENSSYVTGQVIHVDGGMAM